MDLPKGCHAVKLTTKENCGASFLVKLLRIGVTHPFYNILIYIYSETSIHRFRWESEKETMDPGKQ
jgi:hypothetical protein